jgi:hypothetical protein
MKPRCLSLVIPEIDNQHIFLALPLLKTHYYLSDKRPVASAFIPSKSVHQIFTFELSRLLDDQVFKSHSLKLCDGKTEGRYTGILSPAQITNYERCAQSSSDLEKVKNIQIPESGKHRPCKTKEGTLSTQYSWDFQKLNAKTEHCRPSSPILKPLIHRPSATL